MIADVIRDPSERFGANGLRFNVVAFAILLGSVALSIPWWMATANPIPPAVLILAGAVLAQSPRIAKQWERAVILRLGRFVGLRGPVYLAIGGSKYPMLRFELINGAVGLVEVALLVGLGYEFGRSTRLAHEVRFIEIAVGVSVAAVLVIPPIVKWRLVRKHRRAANA